VLFQLYFAMRILKGFAVIRKGDEYAAWLEGKLTDTEDLINTLCWDGDRWIRGFREDGAIIGKRGDPEASMWLNPQSWGVISGASTEERGITSMDSVHRELNTPYGTMVMYPAYQEHAFNGALMQCFNKGSKENAGIFSQTQGWAILAEALLGRGERAFEYWKKASPAYYNEDADRRVLEPYVHGQFIEGKDSPFAGRAHVHWLTGTASTVMVGTVEGILGLRPTPDGLVIDPSIPGDWKDWSMKKMLRGKIMDIKVSNPDGNQHGVKSVSVNGRKMDGNFIPDSILGKVNIVLVEM
jgi:cellobiose phosphorylase